MRQRKTALITGVTGQDGALLARFLLDRGYVVHGLHPYAADGGLSRVQDLMGDRFHLHYGDMADAGCLYRLLLEVQPEEVYNLAALSHVKVSFDVPEYAGNVNGLGVLRLLEAVRILGLADKVRLYQASSSEMFGNAPAPQNEDTPFRPCSPYAAAKLYAYWCVRNYRDAYGLHASNGIMFNHESPIRGEEFVTRKITRAVAAIQAGEQDVLHLGNLDAARDWGDARDYVEGMWLTLQQDSPGDYVFATGVARTVRDFAVAAFSAIGTDMVWQGQGLNEKGLCRASGRVLVTVDPGLFRPNEIHSLIGDPGKAELVLGWRQRTSFETLVRDMVAADRALLAQGNKNAEGNDNNVIWSSEFYLRSAA